MKLDGNAPPPVDTTRQIFYKNAFCESIGYLRGVTSAAEMRAIGTKTWDGNANRTEAWLKNPNRKGEDDLGQIYGAVARNWPKHDGSNINLIRKVYDNLRAGKDDRGEIITFWHPGLFDLGCLRPCMYEYQFTLINGTLHLDCSMRTVDLVLGLGNVNMIQCHFWLNLWAQLTGHKVGTCALRMVGAHIYEDHYELALEQVERPVLENPDLKLWINPAIKTLEDIETWVTVDDFKIIGYDNYHPKIVYPLSV